MDKVYLLMVVESQKKELEEYKNLNESFDFRHKVDTESLFSLEEELEAKDEESEMLEFKLEAVTGHFESKKRMIKSLVGKLEAKNKVISDLKELLIQYRDFAVYNFPDFPDVKKCNDGSVYWCITEGYRGLEFANNDLHAIIKDKG